MRQKVLEDEEQIQGEECSFVRKTGRSGRKTAQEKRIKMPLAKKKRKERVCVGTKARGEQK